MGTRKVKRLPRVKPPKNRNKVKSSASPRTYDESLIRLWALGILFTLALFALWGRAFELQIIMGESLAAKAGRQHMALETLVGVRGSILDRNGNMLARSVDSASVWANPLLIKDRPMTIRVLAKILEADPVRLTKLLEQQKKFVWVVRKVNDTVAKQLKEAALPGVYLTAEYERIYPYKTLAGQLLGFVNVDDQGIEGLEKGLEEQLSASRIRQRVQRDAAGRRLGAVGNDASGLRGSDVYLTIDAQVQFFAEEALAEGVEEFGAKWGGCLVVDVPSGEILAWAQYPFFDPNRPTRFIESVRRNRLASDALEQGSTIKSFLIASALEEKVVTPASEIFCEKGRWKVGSFTIHDTKSYANLAVRKILHVSSNIGVAKIGIKLGAEKYYNYLKRLGFGKMTDLPLAGQSKGILRPAKKWHEIDLVTASFGQSFSASLIQMAQAYLCLVSDGKSRQLVLTLPSKNELDRLANPSESSTEERIFSAETMKQVRAMLKEVVQEDGGTGRHARIPGLSVGGKTGTAQKADRSGRYGKGRVGSFVGMVPIDDPRYLVCVLLDEPVKNQYGGVIATPIFRQVALRTMAYHNLLPDSDDPLVQAMAEKERERRMKLAAAKGDALSRYILEEKQAQTPSLAETKTKHRKAVHRGPQVSLPQRVPNVIGLGVSQAIQIFAGQGIIPSCQGQGEFVVRQSPEPGSSWSAAAQQGCMIWLEERSL